jgi:pyruvate dehydrogenase E1 component
MRARRRALDGPVPERVVRKGSLPTPAGDPFKDLLSGTGEKVKASTTSAFTRLMRNLIKDRQIGKRIVPIIPDEARTFGMDPLFKEVGIYNPLGQRYTAVDKELLLSYREATDGQILEEGITEAGAMADFTAAATS